ncbi:MAG: apolipoprotein N-acyltransferase [Phycisphaerae bacterium]|nr:apolipoprotein N-acyltransferase [Phycisphaerae bacterium]
MKLRVGSPVFVCSGLGLSAFFLSVIQPPCHWYGLAWIAWVPFVLACVTAPSLKVLIPASFFFSTVYWLTSLHWVGPITPPGWIALCLFLALGWPLTASLLRFCFQKKIPLFVACPLILVGAEALQGLPVMSFHWRFLAHSQYDQLTLIQIADVLGAGGVSFLIALVNGVAAQGILSLGLRRLPARGLISGSLIAALAIGATLIYGHQQIRAYNESVTSGPLIASVQSNVPQSVKDSQVASDVIFKDLLSMSQAAAQVEPALIVWPETMVQAILNREIIPYLENKDTSLAFDSALEAHARDTETPLLIGAYGGSLDHNAKGLLSLKTHNSAVLYLGNGTQALKRYDKIALILFGEYMPFKQSWPWLYSLLMKCSPYDYDYSMTPGTEYTVFSINNASHTNTYRFATLICYEDTVPDLVRQFVLSPEHHKQVEWLVNISNDGWFARIKDSQVQSTSELIQHVTAGTFRAIENRVGILRSVNTGISCLIDPLGRLQQGYAHASPSFPKQVQDRQGMAGWFADKMPIYEKVSLFSRYGPWLDRLCAWSYCLIGLTALFSWVRHRYAQNKLASNK